MGFRHGAGVAVALLGALLAGCGGGSDGSSGVAARTGSASCDVPSQLQWLRSDMNDWYFWSGSAPDPDPAAFTTLASYFDARKYANYGGTGRADPWSYFQDTASYNLFFGEGQSMDYGIAVNGLEAQLPLRVRFVEPLSPAGLAGVKRGETIVSLNGVAAADLIAAGDYAVLSPATAGTVLTAVLDDGTGARTVTLTAATYALTPVPSTRVITLPGGAKAGYLMLKEFITQAEAPLTAALADFRAQGATELIVDLRYNGGGRISTARTLASLIAGSLHQNKTFTELRYNARHTDQNVVYPFLSGPAPTFGRVVVLTGQRTCSASELIVNGLAPHVNVVTIGGTTCGKPYGFNPVDSCGNTFSTVNFQAVNATGSGSYDAGLAPTCPVADTFTGTLGDPAEALTAAAVGYLGSGACPATAAGRATALSSRPARAAREPGPRPVMIPD